jgi:integrase/recombinase XerD
MITDAQGHLTTAIHLRNAASKGKSGRIIPLNKELKAVLQLLHKQAAPSPYVITTERSGQFSSAAIVNLFSAWYRWRIAQGRAGHKALSTSQRYIEADAAAQKRVVELV